MTLLENNRYLCCWAKTLTANTKIKLFVKAEKKVQDAVFSDCFGGPYRSGVWNVCFENIRPPRPDRKSTRLNSSHGYISYAGFCVKKKKFAGRHFSCHEARLTYSVSRASRLDA